MTPFGLLYFTDLHARGTNPRARTDDYTAAMFRKLAEIKALAEAHQVKAVLFGGDLFHAPDAADSVKGELIRFLRTFPVPIIGVWGNTHDIWGDNPATLGRTALGVVEASEAIHLLKPGEPYLIEEDGLKIQITGQGYHEHMDRRDWRLDYCVYHQGSPLAPEGHQHWRSPDVTWAIHIVHGMLRTEPLMDGVPVTIVQDVLDTTQANITLSGHDHLGFGVKGELTKLACNPGALMRLTADRKEIDRPVQVALITLSDTCKIELLPITCAAPGPEILDRTHIERAEARGNAMDQFMASVKTGGDFEAIDVAGVVERIAANKNVAAEVKAEAIQRVRMAQEEIGTEDAA